MTLKEAERIVYEVLRPAARGRTWPQPLLRRKRGCMGQEPREILPTLSSVKKCLELPWDLYRVGYAAVLAGMHPKSIYRLVNAGRVRCFGRRGAYRISLSDLLPEVEPGSHKKKK